MKNTLLFLCLLGNTFLYSQSVEIGTNYTPDIPLKHAMPKMSINNGFGAQLNYKPIKKIPLWVSGEGSMGSYANKTIQETYTFTDGATTVTDVQYSSNMHKFLVGLNAEIGDKNKFISGIMSLQGGQIYMNSKIFIEDPNDPNGCKAIEEKTTFSDRKAVVATGAALQLNLSALRSGERRVKQCIEIGLKYTLGGNISYVNINHMKEHQHSVAHNTRQEDNTQDLNVQFVNVTTNAIHSHKVAEIYTSPIRMINFKIAYFIRF